MKTEFLSACDHLVASVLNGVFQGTVLALVVGLTLRWLGRTNAATRHAVWFTTLVLLAGIIPAHYWCGRDLRPEAAGPGSTLGGKTERFTGLSSPARLAGGIGGVTIEPVAMSEDGWPGDPLLSFLLPPESPPEGAGPMGFVPAVLLVPINPGVEKNAGALTGTASGPEPTAATDTPRGTGGLPRPITWNFSPGALGSRILSLVLLAAWVMVAGAKLALLVWRLNQVRRLKAASVKAGGELAAYFRKLCEELRVKRGVDLRVSTSQRSPLLLGFFRPVVLLPDDLGRPLDLEEADQVLRHELAHVNRRDDWANLIQRFLQAIFFFHPAVWWISQRLSLDREIACDDHVLEQGGRPRAYALVLADLATRIQKRTPMLAPGVSTSRRQLQQRINMILNTQRNSSPRLAKTRLGIITTAAAMLAVLALYSAPRLGLAQTATAAGTATAASGASATTVTIPAGTAVIAATAEAGDPEPVTAVVVVEEQPTPAPEDVSPEPKAKPGVAPTPKPHPVVVVPPVTPYRLRSGGVFAATPVPPEDAPRPPRAGRAPRAVDPAEDGASFEERLRRLEKMVESLAAQQSRNRKGPDGVYFRGPGGPDVEIQEKHMAEMKAMAERQAEHAKRATKDAEKALKAENEKLAQILKEAKETSRDRLEGLRKQREALQREVEKVDRQIERLEREKERMNEDKHGRTENEQSRSENEDLIAEKAAQ